MNQAAETRRTLKPARKDIGVFFSNLVSYNNGIWENLPQIWFAPYFRCYFCFFRRSAIH
jgi:hypothetical protein